MRNFIQKWILSKRLQPLRDVPWSRLWYFAAAVFCLFSIIGFFDDLMQLGTMPYAVALIVAVFCGLNAVLWIVVLARLPLIFLVLLGASQPFLGNAINWAVERIQAVYRFPNVASASGIHFSAACILAAAIASYALFCHLYPCPGNRDGANSQRTGAGARDPEDAGAAGGTADRAVRGVWDLRAEP